MMKTKHQESQLRTLQNFFHSHYVLVNLLQLVYFVQAISVLMQQDRSFTMPEIESDID